MDPMKFTGKRSRIAAVCVAAVITALALLSMCVDGRDNTAAPPSTSAKPKAPPPGTTTAAPPRNRTMPGDGTYPMGGVDGKDWGIWQSDGALDGCQWSIRAVSRYAGADVLDSGDAAPGEPVRVDIEPDGGVGVLTGEINGHRIVFATQGCASWHHVR
ncbi:MAG: hypothetical protein ACRDT5_21215 [Mycobacterium sp.]